MMVRNMPNFHRNGDSGAFRQFAKIEDVKGRWKREWEDASGWCNGLACLQQ